MCILYTLICHFCWAGRAPGGPPARTERPFWRAQNSASSAWAEVCSSSSADSRAALPSEPGNAMRASSRRRRRGHVVSRRRLWSGIGKVHAARVTNPGCYPAEASGPRRHKGTEAFPGLVKTRLGGGERPQRHTADLMLRVAGSARIRHQGAGARIRFRSLLEKTGRAKKCAAAPIPSECRVRDALRFSGRAKPPQSAAGASEEPCWGCRLGAQVTCQGHVCVCHVQRSCIGHVSCGRCTLTRASVSGHFVTFLPRDRMPSVKFIALHAHVDAKKNTIRIRD